MTREEYLKMRNNNDASFIYHWYAEHFNKEKHGNFLNIEEFFKFFSMWEGAQYAYNITIDYYDAHFNVLKIPNKEGTSYAFYI